MSRVRSTTSPQSYFGPYYWQAYDPGGNFLFTATTSDAAFTDFKQITDNVTPNFYKRLHSGEFLPVNTMALTETKLTSFRPLVASMIKHVTPPSGVNSYSGTHTVILADSALSVPAPDAAMYDNVVIKALASAKTADWDVLTFVGEFHDTVSLLKTTMERLFSFSYKLAGIAKRREIKRSRRRKLPYSLRQAIRNFNQLWLEGRYGWRPLVYDIQSILKALREKSNNPMARKSATIVQDISAARSAEFHNTDVKYICTTTRTGTCTYHAVVFYKDMMGHIGANPVITAYELTRFSFVVDWFIDINSWLHAILPREGYTELGVSVSAKQDYSDILEETVEEVPGGVYAVSMSQSYRAIQHHRTYDRQAYTTIPLPHINVNLDPLKVLDLITLLVSSGRKNLLSRLTL